MAYLLYRLILGMEIELFHVKSQQVGGKILKGFQLLLADIGALILLESEDEESSIILICSYYGACATTFTSAW
jgi:hypothetical protein